MGIDDMYAERGGGRGARAEERGETNCSEGATGRPRESKDEVQVEAGESERERETEREKERGGEGEGERKSERD